MTGTERHYLAALARLPKALPALAVSLLVLSWLLWVNASGNVFEFDPDEGNNVIKALLVRSGYQYGTEIWTDQPPLFSYLLLPFFAAIGQTMDVARGVVSASSALLVFALYESVRRSAGHLGALVAVLLLLVSALYVPLSVSAMIGLPSVAFLTSSALCSLEAGGVAGRGRRALLLALSAGALAGAAVGTKLFALPVVPALALTTALGTRSGWTVAVDSGSKRTLAARLVDPLLRGSAFCAGFGLLLLLAFAPLLVAGTLSGLVDAHQVAREQAGGTTDGLKTLSGFFAEDRALFALAVLGAALATLRGSFAAWLWLGWLLVTGVALVDHSPVWPHHRVLLTVPAAALAGHAFCLQLPQRIPAPIATGIRIALPLLALVGIAAGASTPKRLEAMIRPPSWTNSERDWEVFAEFQRYAAASKMVATARATYAFRSERPVPPNLAVTSWKRFRVRLLNTKQVVQDIQAARPETILLSHRWPGTVRAAVEKQIKKTHRRVKRWGFQSSDLWVSRELLKSLGESPREEEERPPRRRGGSAP
jgi:hypothetical protein